MQTRVALLVFLALFAAICWVDARPGRSANYYQQIGESPTAHAASHLSNGGDPIAAASNSVRGTILTANDGESSATKAAMSNDSRLTNARTPTAHQATHLSDGSDPISAATNTVRGTVLVANDEENTDQKVPKANDGRLLASTAQKTDLTDGGDTTLHIHTADRARANHTGTQARSTISNFAHADTHAVAGSDPIPESNTITPGLAKFATDGESSALEAVQGNDSRMSNARTPTAHQATHLSDGSDPISPASNTVRGTVLIANNEEADPNKVLKSDDDRLLATGAQRVDLTDGGNTTLHIHSADRARANHTGTQTASTISDLNSVDITWTGSHFWSNPLKAPTGSSAAPSYTFTGRTGDGIYSAGVASLGFALAGLPAGTLAAAGLTINAGQFLGPNGTASAPTFSFSGDGDSGFFRSAANVISGAVSATTMFVLNTTGAKFGDSTAPVTTLQVGDSGSALTSPDSSGNAVTPKIAHWPTSGVAAIGVGVLAGGRNNRMMMFADDANATVGFSSSYSSNSPSFVYRDATSEKFRIDASGNITATVALVVGAPTGGHKGTGTINLGGDIYKNNTAYTNPDYVFEKVFTGSVHRFADRHRAGSYQFMSLQETERYAREHLRLPGISDAPAGMFERSDIALEKIEELYLHVFDLNDRLTRQERWNWVFSAAFVWLYFRTRRRWRL